MNKFKSITGVKNFGGFRILSGDLLKKLMNKVQNICVVFEKINPRGVREIICRRGTTRHEGTSDSVEISLRELGCP